MNIPVLPLNKDEMVIIGKLSVNRNFVKRLFVSLKIIGIRSNPKTWKTEVWASPYVRPHIL